MCDLGLSIEGTEIEPRIAQLTPSSRRAARLPSRTTTCRTNGHARRRARHRHPVLPCAPPLAKLDARDAGSRRRRPQSCLRILRHEAGHAIDNAYQLRRRPTAGACSAPGDR